MGQTWKSDGVQQIEDALAQLDGNGQALVEKFRWLLKTWNTDDDRCFEDFDPNGPYGDDYQNEDEDCEHPGAVLSDSDEPETWYCPDCGETFIHDS